MFADVQAAMRLVDLLIGLEDLVRMHGEAFSIHAWMEFTYRGKEVPAEPTWRRKFERWKVKLRSVGAELSFRAEDGVYALAVDLQGLITQAQARRDELVDAYGQFTGRQKPVAARSLSLKQASAALGIAYKTLLSWVRFSGAPASKVKLTKRGRRGGSMVEYRVNAEELDAWSSKRISKGSPIALSEDRLFRLPVTEAAARIEVARKALNVNKRHFAEMLGISRSTLMNILKSPPKVQTVRLSLVTKAESLPFSAIPRKPTFGLSGPPIGISARIDPVDLQDKLDQAGGSIKAASELYDPPVSQQTIRRLAQTYGLAWNRQTEALVFWLSSTEVKDCLAKGRSLGKAAKLAGVSTPAMSKVVRSYGLQDYAQSCFLGNQLASRDEIEAALQGVAGDVYKAAAALGYKKVSSFAATARKLGMGGQLVFRKRCPQKITREAFEEEINKARKAGHGIMIVFKALETGPGRGRKIAREFGLEEQLDRLNKRPSSAQVAVRRDAFKIMLEGAVQDGLSLREAVDRSGIPRSTFLKRVGEHGLDALVEPLRLESNKRRGRHRKKTPGEDAA